MTAPIRGASLRAPDKLFQDEYLVWDISAPCEACICSGEREARETVAMFKEPSRVRVRRITDGELSRNVTADFFPDEEDESEIEMTPARRRQFMARSGAFGR